MNEEIITWLLTSTEPWTSYRTRLDILSIPDQDRQVQIDREALLSHQCIKKLITDCASWPGYALRRHNDANHPMVKLSLLADFGLSSDDANLNNTTQNILSHQSDQGAFQSLINIPRTFGGSDEDQWAWMLCDAPTLLYSLIRMGMGNEQHVQLAVQHLVTLVEDNGWQCRAAPDLGKFRGPGRKGDPCPIANVYALKALAQIPELVDSSATHLGAEAILYHWENRTKKKYYLFGMGTEFRKIKYPFIWYDVLHVVDVLSQLPFIYSDRRFQEMVSVLKNQADEQGRYTAGSMYQAWKGWSFADKKNPSPWLTFLVTRILHRIVE